DRVDDDFMKAVFELEPDELGVVKNAPETIVYVARLVRRSPSEEIERQRFLQDFQAGGLQRIQPLMQEEHFTYYQNWLRDLEEEMQVEWQVRTTAESE